MAKKPGPYARLFNNFLSSISPRRMFPPAGNIVGKDPFGNKYLEIPPDPRRGKRSAKRWYESPNHHEKETLGHSTTAGFDAKLPAEWESWLRYRRDDTPSDEEVFRSLAIADLKKRNAAELDEKRLQEKLAAGETVTEPQPQDHEKAFYPKYKEYEIMPGEGVDSEDRWKDFKNPYAKSNK